MTDKEKAIVMAHTGICMLTGEKFRVFHAYIEDIMGRPVYTHELAIQSISDEIKEKSRDDFIKLCREEQESCDNAVSRQAVNEQMIKYGFHAPDMTVTEFVEDLPPVTPQPKTGYCKDCKWWKDSDEVYRRGVEADSRCPINLKEVYEGNGYCFMYEPQEK